MKRNRTFPYSNGSLLHPAERQHVNLTDTAIRLEIHTAGAICGLALLACVFIAVGCIFIYRRESLKPIPTREAIRRPTYCTEDTHREYDSEYDIKLDRSFVEDANA